jgi:diaminopimelate epimerase
MGSGGPLPFTKMQAVGNDFVVVEEAMWPADTDWSAAAIRLCDRHFGVGADGLLVVGPSEVANVRMRMFNPDGTEDMCGNGLRCVIAFGVEQGNIPGSGYAETITGRIYYTYGHGNLDVPNNIATVLGAPKFAPADLPMRADGMDRVIGYPLPLASGERLTVSVVSTGTTHTVIWVDELPDDDRFLSVSPAIENHPVFPARTSVLWVKPEGPTTAFVRIWERGAGETLGCGTGAAAVAVLGIEEGRFSRDAVLIRVRSKGGVLDAGYYPNNAEEPVLLVGAAHIVFAGTWHAKG